MTDADKYSRLREAVLRLRMAIDRRYRDYDKHRRHSEAAATGSCLDLIDQLIREHSLKGGDERAMQIPKEGPRWKGQVQ